MIFNTNNNGILRAEQTTPDGGILITREENGTTEYIEEISAGDFVMLLNMYRYIKDNDIQNDFINPYGKNKED